MADQKIVQIMDAQDWYFVHDTPITNKPTAHKIAVWALYGDGSVIGLMGGVESGPGTTCVENRLVAVPPVKGRYKHINDMADDELFSAGIKK